MPYTKTAQTKIQIKRKGDANNVIECICTQKNTIGGFQDALHFGGFN